MIDTAATNSDNEWLDALTTMGIELMRSFEAQLSDEIADIAAKECAKAIGEDRLRDSHFAAIRAHLRAIERNLGRQWVADYLEALCGLYQGPLDKAEADEGAVNEQRAWDRIKRQMTRPMVRNMRERVEEAVR